MEQPSPCLDAFSINEVSERRDEKKEKCYEKRTYCNRKALAITEIEERHIAAVLIARPGPKDRPSCHWKEEPATGRAFPTGSRAATS